MPYYCHQNPNWHNKVLLNFRGCSVSSHATVGLVVWWVVSFNNLVVIVMCWLCPPCADAEEEEEEEEEVLARWESADIKIQPDRSFTPERNLLLPFLSPTHPTLPHPHMSRRFHRRLNIRKAKMLVQSSKLLSEKSKVSCFSDEHTRWWLNHLNRPKTCSKDSQQ